MTWSREALLRGDITQEEFDMMQNMGYDIKYLGNTTTIEDMLPYVYDYGNPTDILKMEELLNNSVDEYKDIIFQERGIIAEYNDVAERWYNTETGQFIVNPYTEIREAFEWE